MNNIDKAARVIHEWLQENFFISQDTGDPRAIAQRIADAGLLAPELPVLHGLSAADPFEYVEGAEIYVYNSRTIYLEGVNYTSEEGIAVFANPSDARKAALALLAAVEQVEGRSTTTVADIPQEEQQKCVGKWCDVIVAGKRHTEVIGSVPDENGLVTLIDPNGGHAYQLENNQLKKSTSA